MTVKTPGGAVNTSASFIGNINPLRYRGYYYDTETGFYYLQSRYYDPQIGRFINADGYASTGQGFLGCNMFAYCHNNPILYVDDSGSLAEEATILATNWWNPVGWVAAVFVVVDIVLLARVIYNATKNVLRAQNTQDYQIPKATGEMSAPNRFSAAKFLKKRQFILQKR